VAKPRRGLIRGTRKWAGRVWGKKPELVPFITHLSPGQAGLEDYNNKMHRIIVGKPIDLSINMQPNIARVGIGGSHGTLELYPHGKNGFEINRFVPKQYRNQGIGTKLLERAEEIARAEGRDYLYAHTYRENTAAIRTYEMMGWRNTGSSEESLYYEKRL